MGTGTIYYGQANSEAVAQARKCFSVRIGWTRLGGWVREWTSLWVLARGAEEVTLLCEALKACTHDNDSGVQTVAEELKPYVESLLRKRKMKNARNESCGVAWKDHAERVA